MSGGEALTKESEALLATNNVENARYGNHHWDTCNGLVDDYWPKCDCGLAQAAFDIEAAAAREALPSVEEMARALRAIGDGPDGCDFAGGEGPDHHSDEFAATLLWHLRAQRGGEGSK